MAEFMPRFDGQISTNFGYLYSNEDVNNLIRQYETATVSSFVDLRTDTTFGKGIYITSSKGRSVCWNSYTTQTQNVSVPGACLKYDGVPFVTVGTKILECHHGKDWKEKQKKKKNEEKQQIPSDAHGYVLKKSRMLIQPTKKLECPARLLVKEIIRFPEFKIDDDTLHWRRTASKNLRQALDADEPPRGERRFYVYLPTNEDHGGTHDTEEEDGDCQRVDSRIIDKIHEVVGTYEVRTVPEMELIIRLFVKDNLGLDPHEGNRRFFPRRADIRYHMNVAQKSLLKHANDQDNLEALIADWEREHEDEQQFFLRKYDEKENGESDTLLFIHQTSWQKKLLLKYGQEMVFLDATYKTVRYALPLFFLAVKTNTGYIIVGTFVVQDEKTNSIKEALEKLKQWNPGWKPKHVMTDCADQEINAVEDVFDNCKVLLCDFHRAQAWERWMNRKENQLQPIKDQVLAQMNRIARSKTQNQYEDAVESLKESVAWRNDRFRRWFDNEWLKIHKRWVCAFRRDRFLVNVNTNNGIERQNRSFKDEYIRKRNTLPLSQMVKILVNEFILNSWKKYKKNNKKASNKTRRYSVNVPTYLHNRPSAVVKHCLQQHQKSKELNEGDTKSTPDDGKYLVRSTSRPTEWYEVDINKPRCTCFVWSYNGLPCKHMFAVFTYTEHKWENLPDSYRNSSFLILDADICSTFESNQHNISPNSGSTVEHDDDDDPEVIEIEESAGDEVDHVGNKYSQSVGKNEVIEIEESAGDEVDHVDNKYSQSVGKLQHQCRDVIRQIRDLTFVVENQPGLSNLLISLEGSLDLLKQCTPQEKGLPLLPTHKDEQARKKIAKKRKHIEATTVKAEPLNKLSRKYRRAHPYTGRHGSKATIMRSNYLTKASAYEISSQGSTTNLEVEKGKDVWKELEESHKGHDVEDEFISTSDIKASRPIDWIKPSTDVAYVEPLKSTETTTSDITELAETEDSEDENNNELPDYGNFVTKTSDGKLNFIKHHQEMYSNEMKKKKTVTSSSSSSIIIIDDEDDSSKGTASKLEPDNQNEEWMEIEKVMLTRRDKSVIEDSSGWLNDRVIDVAQQLIRKACPSINGLQSTLLSYNLGFRMTPPFVQILNVNGNHWITVACIEKPFNTLRVYDSLGSRRMSIGTQETMASLMCSVKDDFFVRFEEVQRQPDSSSCGLLIAIAFAYDLCKKSRQPAGVKYTVSDMRKHLLACIEKSMITPFPTSGSRRIRVGTLDTVEVYCHCRLPWNKYQQSVKQIECSQCFDWFHYPGCESGPAPDLLEKVNYKWYCKSCNPIISNIKKGKWH